METLIYTIVGTIIGSCIFTGSILIGLSLALKDIKKASK